MTKEDIQIAVDKAALACEKVEDSHHVRTGYDMAVQVRVLIGVLNRILKEGIEVSPNENMSQDSTDFTEIWRMYI